MLIVEVGDWISFVPADAVLVLEAPVGQVVEIRTPANPDRDPSDIRVWCSALGRVVRASRVIEVVAVDWKLPAVRRTTCDGT